MGKIDLTINKEGLAHNIKKAKENGIIIPTIAEMQHPETIPEKIQEAKVRRHVGCQPAEPVPHHLEEPAQGRGRAVPGRPELR